MFAVRVAVDVPVLDVRVPTNTVDPATKVEYAMSIPLDENPPARQKTNDEPCIAPARLVNRIVCVTFASAPLFKFGSKYIMR